MRLVAAYLEMNWDDMRLVANNLKVRWDDTSQLFISKWAEIR